MEIFTKPTIPGRNHRLCGKPVKRGVNFHCVELRGVK
jgi:hypothetical protein